MSSGSLPLVSYHRASHLGDGSFGSVVTVYNDDGAEFALKLFLPEEEEGEDENVNDSDDDEEEATSARRKPMEVGALREISCLRLLRAGNRHDNIVELQDVQTEWDEQEEGGGGGAGTAGCLGMALPLGQHGSLADAIARRTFRGYPKRAKVQIAHGLLSAVAFLHDNGLIHRDIKSDNVLLERRNEGENKEEDNSNDEWKPILIDFSLAKPIDGTMWGNPALHADQLESLEHTGEVGTVVYTAPEIVDRQPYGKPADLFSVGVVLLELLQNEPLAAAKASHAAAELQRAVRALPESAPFPNLIRSLLKRDPSERWTARQALEHPLFAKFGFSAPPPEPRIVNVGTALPYDAEEEEEENEAPPAASKKTPLKKNRQKSKKLERRLQRIDRILRELDSAHPWTRAAAFEYSRQMEQVEDAVDDDASQVLADCCVLAHRVFELHLPDLDDLQERDAGVFAHWTVENYVDNEATIFMLLDFCLYPRSLTFGHH